MLFIEIEIERDISHLSILTSILHNHKDHILSVSQLPGQRGNYPNEEYFCKRIETSPEISSGLQLREEEEEVIAGEKETSPLRNGLCFPTIKDRCQN